MAKTDPILYHNPRCSKSRLALELLRKAGVEPKVVEYLKTPLDAITLDRILTLLQREPREMLRSGEVEYQTLGLSDPSLSRKALIDAMISHPALIERPILLANNKASLGRPPEDILEIL